ncbi:MAG: hypothetical protein JWN04_6620 [Myxococcaceae bacterium]|nr:hypothetical protein [Myxococcaceae bacterium]
MTVDNIPRSRLTLTYQTEISGKPKEVELPFRMLILGDLSGKKDHARGDLDQRPIRRLDGSNLNKVMADMGLTTSVEVPNRIGHAEGNLKVDLQFKDMRSFSPDAVSEQIKPVKALKLLKALLLEAQANLDNSKEFRGLIRDLPAQSGELAHALEGFQHYSVKHLGPTRSAEAAGQEKGRNPKSSPEAQSPSTTDTTKGGSNG